MKIVDPHRDSNPSTNLPPAIATPTVEGRVLIVDDDKSLLETISDLLEISGFRPIMAFDAVEALGVLQQKQNVDALITDLSMPGLDGIALIHRAHEIRPNLPAILLTGYAEHASSVVMTDRGSFHILRKPVESGRLIQQLELLVTRTAPLTGPIP